MPTESSRANASEPVGEPPLGDARRSESTLRALLDNTPSMMGVVELAPDGSDVLHVLDNAYAERFFGVPPGATAGKWARRELGVAAETIDRWGEAYREAKRTGRPVRFAFAGASRWLDVSVSYMGPGTDGRDRFCYTALDDTDRRRAEATRRQAEQRLALLAAAGEVLTDVRDLPSTLRRVVRLSLPLFADWCIVDVVGEDGAIERVAVAHAEPDREPLVEALRTRYPPTWDSQVPVVGVLRTGQPALVGRIDAPLRRALARDDEHARLLAALDPRSTIVVPLTARGQTFGAIGFVRSGAVAYEPADLEFALELARRAAAALDNARLFQQLTASDRRKDEFLATMAHELRNPLAPIRNAVAVLRAKGPPDPELTWSREVIARQVGQMARLLDDLLDVSRITRNKLELRRQRVTLAEVIDGAVETSRPLLDAQSHALTVELPREPVPLDGDPVRLAQVFANLLNNAAKYTDRGGRVRLTAARRDATVTVTVADTGIGIAREVLPRLFEMFSQAAPAIDRAQGGLGIGLALVRGLVQMHGGHVEARSDGPGRGSTFVVTLPLAAGAGPTHEPPAREPAPRSRAGMCRIVVADDNCDAADSLAMLLGVHGHEVRIAHDGPQALALTTQFRPDVALFDIGMPGLNGYDVARRVRAEPWGRALVLVALTGWGQEEDKRRAHEAGFDRHMTKPVDPAELALLLGELAGRRTGPPPVSG